LAGDVDYDVHGQGYRRQRRTDPRIAAYVHAALGTARTVLNVGAGAGSYEPEDRYVLAVEPSATMRAQRPAHLAPAIHGVAEHLPLDDQSVDAAMAMLTIHQWLDVDKGLDELCRVTRGPIVILTFDGDSLDRYWLAQYIPDIIAVESRRFPPIDTIRAKLGESSAVQTIPIPADCVDGFTEAYYARPEMFLDNAVRRAQSMWSFAAEGVEEQFVQRLGDDLASGAWDRKFGQWRRQPYFEGSLRLIVGNPSGHASYDRN
jgi:SAM-dependent methyltransferase